MARYIDAEKLCKSLRDMAFYQNPYKQSTILGVVSSIEDFPAADVAPKSEYDELKAMLDAAVAGQETLQEALAEARSELVSEVIDFMKVEIENLKDHTPTEKLDQAIDLVKWILGHVINDLEKIYTEGKTDENISD